jgi:hypothetical protein
MNPSGKPKEFLLRARLETLRLPVAATVPQEQGGDVAGTLSKHESVDVLTSELVAP